MVKRKLPMVGTEMVELGTRTETGGKPSNLSSSSGGRRRGQWLLFGNPIPPLKVDEESGQDLLPIRNSVNNSNSCRTRRRSKFAI